MDGEFLRHRVADSCYDMSRMLTATQEPMNNVFIAVWLGGTGNINEVILVLHEKRKFGTKLRWVTVCG